MYGFKEGQHIVYEQMYLSHFCQQSLELKVPQSESTQKC